MLVTAPVLADLDLDPRDVVLLYPFSQLVPGLAVVVAGETAAPVDGHAVAGLAEQPGQRAAEQPRLEIPQRDVHGGDRCRGDAGPADVAYCTCHRFRRTGHVQCAAPGDRARQHIGDDALRRRGRVGPADALGCPGPDGGDNYRGFVPGERPVRLGGIGRNYVNGGGDLPHGRPVILHGSVPFAT